jgi:hypothetical protein
VNANPNRLMALTKELRAEWEQTRQYWNDSKSQEFEATFLNGLLDGVNRTIANIDALERVLDKIRTDCE